MVSILIDCLIDWSYIVLHPSWNYFIPMETSPLPVNGFKTLAFDLHLWSLSREDLNHAIHCCDTGPRFLGYHPQARPILYHERQAGYWRSSLTRSLREYLNMFSLLCNNPPPFSLWNVNLTSFTLNELNYHSLYFANIKIKSLVNLFLLRWKSMSNMKDILKYYWVDFTSMWWPYSSNYNRNNKHIIYGVYCDWLIHWSYWV